MWRLSKLYTRTQARIAETCNFFRQCCLLTSIECDISTLPGETTLNRAIEVPMRIKCLLAITGALLLLLLIATLAYAYIEVVS